MYISPQFLDLSILAVAPVTVQIDWFEQLAKGGWVIWVQGALVVALGAIVVERLMTLRTKNFVPPKLPDAVLKASRAGDGAKIVALCKKQPSTYSEALLFAMDHRDSKPDDLSNGIRDIASAGIEAEYEKLAGLSLIAATAPLLGLLGTMIGMIESFQLVALFGDEGGASLLADSIAKALITTAVGLIIALPSLFMHHFFKRRLQDITRELEKALTAIHREWFLSRGKSPGTGIESAVTADSDEPLPHEAPLVRS